VSIAFKKDTRTIIYKREFVFKPLQFPKTSYAQVKRLFTTLHQRDSHTLSLKAGGGGNSRAEASARH
jgi:hypothetical protein